MVSEQANGVDGVDKNEASEGTMDVILDGLGDAIKESLNTYIVKMVMPILIGRFILIGTTIWNAVPSSEYFVSLDELAKKLI